MKYRFKGLDEYVKKLEYLSNPNNVQACIENAVGEGSKVVAEFTGKELTSIPTDDTPQKLDRRKGIRSVQKAFLLKEFGVTPIDQKKSFINKKTGVAKGVLRLKGSRNYTPAVTLARMLEHGTSYTPKIPVFSRASRKARKPCLEAMQNSLNADIQEIFNYNNKIVRRRDING